ncbi:MAG: amino acid permease [Rhodothermales bacterium]
MPDEKIGFWPSTALVVGNMIGSGIFLLPASLAIYGGISLLGWVIAAAGAMLLAVVFGNLSRYVPDSTGGPYAYTKISLGEFPAYLVAWGYWISIWSTNAAIAVALVGYLAVFFPVLSTDPMAAILTGLSFIWLITWVNTKSLQTVGLVQLATTVLKVAPITVIGLLGLFYVKEAGAFPAFNLTGESNISALTATVTLTFFAFLGIESATIPSANIKDAGRTVKKATIVGTMIAIVAYVLSSGVIMALIPAETLATSSAPFADAAAVMWGEPARKLVALGAVISTLGALNGWILIQGQIPMAAAHDKLFPQVFGKQNKQGAPAVGIVLSSILVSVLMMTNYHKSLVEAFTFMMLLSTLSVLTPYLFSIASYGLMLFEREEQGKTRKLVVALLAFCFSIWIVIGCGHEVVFLGFILLMMGIPFYVWLKRT